MTQIIPLNPVPSQIFSVTLEGLPCRFWVRQVSSGLILDLFVNNQAQILGMLCRDRVTFTGGKCSPLKGALSFIDRQGTDDPSYMNLGGRFILNYRE